MTTDDIELVRAYAAQQSEQAFETLVSRHVNLVYSTALRQVRDPHLAEEITQAVFIILARKAAALNAGTILPAWLYRTACYAATDALKIQRRRQRREQEAYMQSELRSTAPDPLWELVSPHLDEALMRLGEKDRQAVVLHFVEKRTFVEVGNLLETSEEGARKRAHRALDKLRHHLSRRGLVATAAIIAGTISANSVHAAPVALAKTVTAVAMTKGVAASGSTLTLIKGALKIMAWTKAKTAIVVGVAAILAVGTTTLAVHQHYAGAQTDFPSSSWTNAGYADPPTAVLSTLWAIKQGDGEKIADSFTPELQQQFQQMFAKQMQAEGKSFIEILSQEAPKHFSQNTGIKILGQKTAFGDQIALRVYVPGEQREHTFFLKKISNEWKVNDIE